MEALRTSPEWCAVSHHPSARASKAQAVLVAEMENILSTTDVRDFIQKLDWLEKCARQVQKKNQESLIVFLESTKSDYFDALSNQCDRLLLANPERHTQWLLTSRILRHLVVLVQCANTGAFWRECQMILFYWFAPFVFRLFETQPSRTDVLFALRVLTTGNRRCIRACLEFWPQTLQWLLAALDDPLPSSHAVQFVLLLMQNFALDKKVGFSEALAGKLLGLAEKPQTAVLALDCLTDCGVFANERHERDTLRLVRNNLVDATQRGDDAALGQTLTHLARICSHSPNLVVEHVDLQRYILPNIDVVCGRETIVCPALECLNGLLPSWSLPADVVRAVSRIASSEVTTTQTKFVAGRLLSRLPRVEFWVVATTAHVAFLEMPSRPKEAVAFFQSCWTSDPQIAFRVWSWPALTRSSREETRLGRLVVAEMVDAIASGTQQRDVQETMIVCLDAILSFAREHKLKIVQNDILESLEHKVPIREHAFPVTQVLSKRAKMLGLGTPEGNKLSKFIGE